VANDLEELYALLENESPEQQMTDLGLLAELLRMPTPKVGLPLSECVIKQLVYCLERAFAPQTNSDEPLEQNKQYRYPSNG
jgi:hypothetical protein